MIKVDVFHYTYIYDLLSYIYQHLPRFSRVRLKPKSKSESSRQYLEMRVCSERKESFESATCVRDLLSTVPSYLCHKLAAELRQHALVESVAIGPEGT